MGQFVNQPICFYIRICISTIKWASLNDKGLPGRELRVVGRPICLQLAAGLNKGSKIPIEGEFAERLGYYLIRLTAPRFHVFSALRNCCNCGSWNIEP